MIAENSRERAPRVSYSRELEELPVTLRSALDIDIEPLQKVLAAVHTGPARFVGTGGTYAVAQLAADLHEAAARQPGRAMTPLEFVQAPRLRSSAAVFFSARAKHPDAHLVLAEMAAAEYRPAVLMTQRSPDEIQLFETSDLVIQQMPRPSVREGFLATNSVLAMVVMLLRAHNSPLQKMSLTPAREMAEEVPARTSQLVVLYPPPLTAVAIDIETRISELGLCAVQLADLRNIAHGRHTGLARNANSTVILTLSDSKSEPLARAVSRVLRDSGAAQTNWSVAAPTPAAIVQLLAASMHLTERLATEQGVDVGRPQVPAFGRRLYNLPIKRLLARPPRSAVDRKIDALGHESPAIRANYGRAYEEWRKDLASVAFGGVLLDYDGTVCWTSHRTKPPSTELRAEILRLLEGGVVLGFASGRGRSLHQGLREWIDPRLWGRVVLGLYNGSVRLKLSEDLEHPTELHKIIGLAYERLRTSSLKDVVDLQPRATQLTVEAAAGYLSGTRLADLVCEILAREPALPTKVVASGHSVDIVASDTSKVLVIDAVRAEQVGEVLVVGDQGDVGGNDFEMLAATQWSMSVSRCSADPTRCWPSDDRGRHGPAGLRALLHSLRVAHGLGHVAPPPRRRSNA